MNVSGRASRSFAERLANIMLVLSFLPTVACAFQPRPVTPAEFALMPDYCQVRLTKPRDEIKASAWATKFGSTLWNSLHHYCNGLNFEQRAMRAGIEKRERDSNLVRAIAEYNYVLRAAMAKPAGQWFAPHIHMHKAGVLDKLGRRADAAKERELARSTSP